MRVIKTASALVLSVAIAGCASSPEQVGAAYVSPVAYQGMTCQALAQEKNRVATKLNEAHAAQSAAASGDSAKMAVALVLFAPAALFISGDKSTAAELGRLKGEHQTIEAQMSAKGW